ncbi:MAG: TolC family protein, partial [Sulfurimonadaceae bacterium]|nr:TolC family protein [Sulfurimonadaceae bacterium]
MKSNFLKILIVLIVGSSFANAYTSPTDAYKAAIEYSTKVNSSKYSYESRKEGLNEVYGKLYPQLEGSLGYARTDYTRNDMAGRKGDPRSQESTRELGLTLSQVIYDPTLMTAIDVEKSRIKYFYYGHELEKQKVATEALDIYMTVLNIKNKIDLLKSNLSYVEQNQKMIEEKYSMSLVTKMDYLKVKVEAQK